MVFTNGSDRVFTQQTINNSGTVLWADGANLTLAGGAVFNNLADGVFKVTHNGSMVNDNSSAFNNYGLFEQTAGAGETTLGTFTNYGTVSVRSGTMTFVYNYEQEAGATILAGGDLCAWPNAVSIRGGALEGQGTIEAGNWNPGVYNNGTIIPTGILKIANSSYGQTSSGAMNIALGGATAGSGYGQLIVGGGANLDGALNITLTNGFHPRPGDRFEVLKYRSHSGKFAVIRGLDLGTGLALRPDYTGSKLTLTVVTEGTSPIHETLATANIQP
jgi:hypothetical protein